MGGREWQKVKKILLMKAFVCFYEHDKNFREGLIAMLDELEPQVVCKCIENQKYQGLRAFASGFFCNDFKLIL